MTNRRVYPRKFKIFSVQQMRPRMFNHFERLAVKTVLGETVMGDSLLYQPKSITI